MDNAAVPPVAEPRPLWRKVWEFPLVAMLVALVLVYLVLWAVQWALFYTLPAGMDAAADATIRALVAVAATLAIYKLAIRRLGARPRDDLPGKGAVGDTSLGIGVGAAVFAVVVGLAAVFGVYRIYGPGTLENAVPFLMMGGVVAAFVEEVIFRGIVFRWVEEFGGSWLALAVSSALFGLAHGLNHGATWFSTLAIAVEAGVLLGGAYMLTRSLWLAIGIHAGWNVTQGLVFDVPVSGFPVEGAVEAVLDGPELLTGGAFGLEASVLALVVATAAGVWMLWQARKGGCWVAPMWKR
jgi:uncharacterized protein